MLVAASGRVFGPRMDYDEWTPLGHGDPLKNDPTYDYVPPVLERVHYWMEPKESNARRDSSADSFVKFVDSAVPVPATMLVPPPLPPQPPASTTPAPTALTADSPPPSSAYSSLNPYHHFEDRPVVPNVHFEEKPLRFDTPLVSNVFEDGRLADGSSASSGSGGSQAEMFAHFHKPVLHLDMPPPAGNGVVFDVDKPTAGPRPTPRPMSSKTNYDDKLSDNVIRFDGKPSSSKGAHPMIPLAPVEERPPRGPPPPAAPRPEEQPAALSNVIGGSGAPDTPESLPRPLPAKPPAQQPPAMMTPPPPPTTSSSLPPPPTPTRAAPGAAPAVPSSGLSGSGGDISSLIRGLLHQEAATTATSLTTDPLFAHYKQPVTPVNGPPYLIIQGHSKVKTYGPSLVRATNIHGMMQHGHGHGHKDLHYNRIASHRLGHRTRRRAPA